MSDVVASFVSYPHFFWDGPSYSQLVAVYGDKASAEL